MNRLTRIIIPEPLDGYRETIALGLTLKQFVLVSLGVVLLSLALFTWSSGYWIVSLGLLGTLFLGAFGAIEIEHKSLVYHILLRIYFLRRPKVLVYHHFETVPQTEAVPTPSSQKRMVPGWILLVGMVSVLSILGLVGIGYMVVIGLNS